jgi:thioredoxin 1
MPDGVVALDEPGFAATGEGIWLIDFWAAWCSPCRALEPVLEQLAGEVAPARIGKVEVTEQKALAERFAVSTLPTLVVLRDGVEVKRMIGARPKQALARALAEA